MQDTATAVMKRCDLLTNISEESGLIVRSCGSQAMLHRLPSGAGYDATQMVDLTPVAMLFVRCEEGISHNPAESVTEGR